MCVKLRKGHSDDVRKVLLDKYSTGVIALGDVIRIAYSSIPYDMIEQLFENLYNAACECAK